MQRGRPGWSWCRGDLLPALRAAVLGKLEAPLVQALALLLLVPLRPIVELLRGLHYVLRWREEHAPPLWEVHQGHGQRAAHDHDPHEREASSCGEARASEEDQLSQSGAKVPSCAGETRYDSQGPAGNEGYDPERRSARRLSSN